MTGFNSTRSLNHRSIIGLRYDFFFLPSVAHFAMSVCPLKKFGDTYSIKSSSMDGHAASSSLWPLRSL